MRKLFLLLVAFANTSAVAQQIINSGFENWANPNVPDGWGILGAVSRNTDTAYIMEGSSSVKLETISPFDTIIGNDTLHIIYSSLIYGGLDANGNPIKHPITGRPDSFYISYAFLPQGNDSTGFEMTLYKNGIAIGRVQPLLYPPYWFSDTMKTYGFKVFYENYSTPDSFTLGFLSSYNLYAPPTIGSAMYIDDIRFVGYDDDTAYVPHVCTTNANFNIYPDSNASHTWIIENLSTLDSTGSFYVYAWYWGDGDSTLVGATTSGGLTFQDITHTYSQPGYYNICLYIFPISVGGCESYYCDSSTYIFKTEEVISVRVVDDRNSSSNISETKNNSSISIYPNPSKGKFTLTSDISQGGVVEVYNITGARVEMHNCASLRKADIDISNQASGVYLVKISNAENVWTQRVIVE